MKVLCYWKNCHLHDGQTSFWIEVTKEELESGVFALDIPVVVTNGEMICSTASELIKNYPDHTELFYFLVSRKVDAIHSFPEQYPYANLWNGYSPFVAVEPIHIQTLVEIRRIRISRLKVSDG